MASTRLGTGCPGLQPPSWTHPVRAAVFSAALACLALFFAPGFNGSVHAQDDDLPVVTVQDTALSVAEVTHGVSVCAVASSAGDLPMRVQAKTVSGTATEGEDFRAASASLVPTPNGSCFTVMILNDDHREGNETFAVTLSDPENATLGNSVATTITVLANDGPPSGLTAGARQIEARLAAKTQRTPAQRKVSSQLLDAWRSVHGQPAADELVVVDIRADVTSLVLARIRSLGGTVINSVPKYRAIRARLPLSAVETIATLDAVKSIRHADEAVTRGPAP